MYLVVNTAAKVLRLTPILPVLMLMLVDKYSYLELGIFLIGVYSSGCVIGYLYNAVATAYVRSPE